MRTVVQFVKATAALLFLAFAIQSVFAAPLPNPRELISTGRVDDAVNMLKARLASAPNDADAYHLLSLAYYHTRNWDQAIDFAERASQLAPNNAEYHLWLGRAYGEKASDSSWLTAIRLAKQTRTQFERAVELNGSDVAARSDLTEYYVEAPGFLGGGTDKARSEAAQISALDKAKGHWAYGRIAEKKKDLDTAESEYKAAIQASHSADDWLGLASYYRRQERLSDMDAAINNALHADRQPSNTLYDAAALLYRTNRNLNSAADLVRKYLAQGPNEDAPAFQAHYMLGSILEKAGNNNLAAAEYRQSITLASNYKPAQEALNRVAGQQSAGR